MQQIGNSTECRMLHACLHSVIFIYSSLSISHSKYWTLRDFKPAEVKLFQALNGSVVFWRCAYNRVGIACSDYVISCFLACRRREKGIHPRVLWHNQTCDKDTSLVDGAHAELQGHPVTSFHWQCPCRDYVTTWQYCYQAVTDKIEGPLCSMEQLKSSQSDSADLPGHTICTAFWFHH